jgi:hypothetical protein
MACPECAAASGMPYMATTTLQRDGISVGMRCAECAHEWSYHMPATGPTRMAAWPKKADRRMPFPKGPAAQRK